MANHKAATIVPSNPDETNSNIDDYGATADLPAFAAPIEPTLLFPMIRYAKGVTVVSGAKPIRYTGFHIQTEQSAELDALLEDQGVSSVRVRHQNGNEATYWQLDSIKGSILCTAIPSSYNPEAWKSGMAYVWNTHRDTYAYGSQLQCLFFAKGLLEVGYAQPMVLSLSRTVTEHFTSRVLRRQEAMIATIKKALKNHGKPDELAFYAYWLELIKGEEVTTKGGGSYFAPALTMPSPLTVEYIKTHETPREHLAIIESHLPILPQWAQAASARLLEPPRENGNGNGWTSAAPTEPDPDDFFAE